MMRQHKLIMALMVGVILSACSKPSGKTPTADDAVGLGRLLQDSQWLVNGLKNNRDFFERPETEPLTADERATIMPVWAALVDHDLAYESYKSIFLDNSGRLKDQNDRARAFLIGYVAYLAQLREFFVLLGVSRDREVFAVAFNEEAVEYGLSAGHYERMLFRLASPQTYLKFSILSKQFEKLLKRLQEQNLEQDEVLLSIASEAKQWTENVEDSFEEYGTRIMEEVAVKIATNELNQIVLPLQTDIALWLGDTKIRSSERSLISKENLDELLPMLEPGDLLIERRNWYLSNLGLPGFWPHAAFFLGSAEELAAFFDDDPEVQAAFPDGFTQYLETKYPEAWKKYLELDKDGEKYRVIESISDGVVFTSLYYSGLADYLGVMRPMRSKLERAWAVENTFQHHGKPYDFDFSFLSQSELVCSELVWTAYQLTSDEGEGLNLKTSTVFGRVTLPPTDIVKQFDEEYGTPLQQLEFVAFVDGVESTSSAFFSTLEEFRKSWRRPKWDLSQQ